MEHGDADALVVDGTYPRVDGRLARSGSACPVYCAADGHPNGDLQ